MLAVIKLLFLVTFLSCLLMVASEISADAKDQFTKKIIKLAEECKTEVAASTDDVEPLLNSQPPVTEKGKCFIACLHKKLGVLNSSGKIDKKGSYSLVETLKEIDEETYEKMKKIADICLTEVTDGPNECETSTQLYICVKVEQAAHGIKPINWKS